MNSKIEINPNEQTETIAKTIINNMEEINTKLVAIKVYDKEVHDKVRSITELKSIAENYDAINKDIANFIDFIKTEAFKAVDPEHIGLIKEQAYTLVFSSKSTARVELLCCAEKLDNDQLLVCARRANLCDKKRLLFICDLDFIKEELLGKDVKITNVINLGILHHYSVRDFTVNPEGKVEFSTAMNPGVENTVKKVFDVIPKLTKENIHETPLKVVLRCCSGAESKNDTINFLEQTVAYPIKLLPPSIDIKQFIKPNIKSDKKVNEKLSDEEISKRIDAAAEAKKGRNSNSSQAETANQPNAEQLIEINDYRNNQFNQARKLNNLTRGEKGNICIRQDWLGDRIETKLYLPFANCDPILLVNFPELTTESNFKEFSNKLIKYLQEYKDRSLHINPYEINLIISAPSYTDKTSTIFQSGLKKFKGVIGMEVIKINGKPDIPASGLLAEWESNKKLPSTSKKDYQQLFTPANDLKDVAPIPKDTYAAKLLTAIKGCPNVSVFKSYYARYKAAPNRMVHAISGGSAKGKDASYPKAIVVSRNTFWKEEKTDQPQHSDMEDIKPNKN